MIGEAVYGYWTPCFWGLAVLAGFLGWGSAIQRAGSLPQTDWGLRCAWGMAFVTVSGGLLACLSLAAKPVLIGMVAAGALLAVLFCGPSLSSILTNRRSTLGVFGFVALILLFYAAFVDVRWSNACDDDVAYFVFAKRLLDSGTLIEPFSLRRLSAYGGHSLLQAVIWAFGSQKSLYILDAGLCGVVLAGMIFGSCRRAKISIGCACLIAGAAILLPVPRINSMSQATGIVLFFALFRTLRNSAQRTPRWQDCAIAGMCTAAGM
uniref:Glycosyltransferase RgtA/B/C/D-like domain-containing protein n=1 Tax=Solibacter usitatus (strain Ellin6076) TaxID=234267 RepID=Q029C4_SOLUE